MVYQFWLFQIGHGINFQMKFFPELIDQLSLVNIPEWSSLSREWMSSWFGCAPNCSKTICEQEQVRASSRGMHTTKDNISQHLAQSVFYWKWNELSKRDMNVYFLKVEHTKYCFHFPDCFLPWFLGWDRAVASLAWNSSQKIIRVWIIIFIAPSP